MTLYNGHFKFQNFNVAYACILWVPAQTIDQERLVSQTRSTHQIPIICRKPGSNLLGVVCNYALINEGFNYLYTRLNPDVK